MNHLNINIKANNEIIEKYQYQNPIAKIETETVDLGDISKLLAIER